MGGEGEVVVEHRNVYWCGDGVVVALYCVDVVADAHDVRFDWWDDCARTIVGGTGIVAVFVIVGWLLLWLLLMFVVFVLFGVVVVLVVIVMGLGFGGFCCFLMCVSAVAVGFVLLVGSAIVGVLVFGSSVLFVGIVVVFATASIVVLSGVS